MTRRDCQECSEYEADAGDVLCYRCKAKPPVLTVVSKPALLTKVSQKEAGQMCSVLEEGLIH